MKNQKKKLRNNYKMPIYYIVFLQTEVIPCYLIKEGYIPCQDYRPDRNHMYYSCSPREEFIIAHPSDIENIFINKKKAILTALNNVEEGFKHGIKSLVEDYNKNKEYLNKILEINDE